MIETGAQRGDQQQQQNPGHHGRADDSPELEPQEKITEHQTAEAKTQHHREGLAQGDAVNKKRRKGEPANPIPAVFGAVDLAQGKKCGQKQVGRKVESATRQGREQQALRQLLGKTEGVDHAVELQDAQSGQKRRRHTQEP